MLATSPSPALTQDSPTQEWIGGWLEFLDTTLPMVFLVIVILVGTILIVRSRGGLQKAIVFGIGAALVFLILTNVEALSSLFGEELPVDSD
jgi:type IV secretory pathway VirB2 component (pilin)